jgi:predicted nucleotidyltransferase
METSKQKVIKILQLNQDFLVNIGVKDLFLFGSYARNEANEQSDVDLLIDFLPGKKSLKNIIEIGDFLENILGKKVDILTRNGLSKHIGPHILNTLEHVPFAA